VTAGSLRHDLRPRVPAHFLRAYPARPPGQTVLARKRPQQRWSGLLKRIAKQVRATLGDALWADFVAHASYAATHATRTPSKCLPQADSSHGGACPRDSNVDVTCVRAYVTLGELHLDHEQLGRDRDVRHVGAGARACGTTASTARCCATCSSRCTSTTRRKGRRCCASVAALCMLVHGQHGTKTNYCHKLNYRGLRDVAQSTISTCRAEREESELAQEGRDAAKPGDAHRARWAARWASCVWPLAWGCAAEPVMPLHSQPFPERINIEGRDTQKNSVACFSFELALRSLPAVVMQPTRAQISIK
jgi:hypothetical protein